MDARTIHKYLEKHAEAQAIAIAKQWPDTHYQNCIVIPLMGEADWTGDGLKSLEVASTKTPGNTLGVLIINENCNTSDELRKENQVCLRHLRLLSGKRTHLSAEGSLLEYQTNLSLLIIDLTAPQNQFSPKEGVGIARKFGMDLATYLSQIQKLTTRFIHTTDGDVVIAMDYFSAAEKAPNNCSIFLHPFDHTGRYEQSEALTLYELSLRYYVLGMKSAGSPYAFQTIGSTIAISPETYASVRGFPKRNAAEDFYLLNKAIKTSNIYSAKEGRIKIKGRTSDRVPFGTGVGTEKYWKLLEKAEEPQFYSPKSFELLKSVLLAMGEFSIHLDTSIFEKKLAEQIESRWGNLVQIKFSELLKRLGILSELDTAKKTRNSSSAVYRHLMENFDAFRTLRFIHEVRDCIFPNLPWKMALSQAPFVNLSGMDSMSKESLLEQLVVQEEKLSGLQLFPGN